GEVDSPELPFTNPLQGDTAMARTCWGVVLAACVVCLALAPTPATAQKTKDVYLTVKGYAAVCKTFAKALETSQIHVLYQRSKEPITLFAPTDDAFGKMKKEDLDEIFANKPKLVKLIVFHSIEGHELKTEDLLAKGTFPNSINRPFTFKKDG